MRRPRLAAALAATVIAGTATAAITTSEAAAHHPPSGHVLLLSVDGMHQSDLEWWINHHPGSALDRLVKAGVEFANAQTPFPSDSFPGMTALATGGNPTSTGILYDDSFNRALLPPGTKPADCATAKPGTEVGYAENADKDPTALDAGQKLPGLPGGILAMTGDPRAVIDPAQLPVDPKSCAPVFPHQYLRVNTIFEVARTAGLRTAWSDKHPAYELLNGPSGKGVHDLFTPEVNSNANAAGDDWTKNNKSTQQYDGYKVKAVLNWIDGLDHSGKKKAGVPAIFGMNFQTVSTAQKLPTSDGQPGGYLADGVTPGPVLQGGLKFVDDQLGKMVDELKAKGLDKSTEIILSAKHGQSPQNPLALTRIPDKPIIKALNDKWALANPGKPPLVSFSINDDGMLLWLSDRSDAATKFAKDFLLGPDGSGTGNDINGKPKAYTASGLQTVYAGADAAKLLGLPQSDPRVPDLIGVVQYGVVYTGGTGKIAEHGGNNPQDRWVPLVVSGPVGKSAGKIVHTSVETTQVAPTILDYLGLDPGSLKSVKIEHTAVLPLG